MSILLGIDFETTGLDPTTDRIIEIGACLWATEVNKPINMFSTLCRLDVGEEPSQEIQYITGIDPVILGEGLDIKNAINTLVAFSESASYIVAHNAVFEKGFLAAHPEASEMLNKPWIDTKTDLPYPPRVGNGTLTHIAADHGFVNPFPHRALPDVLTMLKILSLYDFAEVERYAKAPTVNLMTSFRYDDTGERQKQIKSLGFYWNPAEKYWYKPVKAFLFDQEAEKAKALGFTVSTG